MTVDVKTEVVLTHSAAKIAYAIRPLVLALLHGRCGESDSADGTFFILIKDVLASHAADRALAILPVVSTGDETFGTDAVLPHVLAVFVELIALGAVSVIEIVLALVAAMLADTVYPLVLAFGGHKSLKTAHGTGVIVVGIEIVLADLGTHRAYALVPIVLAGDATAYAHAV